MLWHHHDQDFSPELYFFAGKIAGEIFFAGKIVGEIGLSLMRY